MDIEQLRNFCLSLPGTGEGVKYGDQLCFMVLGKVFCSSNLKNLDRANFKVADEAFEEMCERPGVRPAPYGGAKFKWVQAENFDCFTDREWKEYLRQAYELVKAKLTKKEQAMLDQEQSA